VRNGYVDPQQLGVDRWLAMLAAFARYRSALCVVDSGTALTIDAVSGDGVHQGGLIMPGFSLMRDALKARTGEIARLGRVFSAPDAGRQFWGRDTDGCIRRGATAAADGLIGLCVAELSRSAASPVKLVLTGGDADNLRDGLSQPADICPFLVLEGLALRYGGD
jgi:type III pantothenate kinase